VFGFAGLGWAGFTLPQSRAVDQFRDIESGLLSSEKFNPAALAQMFESPASNNVSACDTHSQRALLFMEMPLADVALRSGNSQKFDEHIKSLENRMSQILQCAPRESIVWLALFNLKVLHGQLNRQSFELLAMSYKTSPNEAWISIRRTIIATPLLLEVGAGLRETILFEFRQLICNGFAANAARSYSLSPQPVRSILQGQIELLNSSQRKAFSDSFENISF
jgi:hypothetical protein